MPKYESVIFSKQYTEHKVVERVRSETIGSTDMVDSTKTVRGYMRVTKEVNGYAIFDCLEDSRSQKTEAFVQWFGEYERDKAIETALDSAREKQKVQFVKERINGKRKG